MVPCSTSKSCLCRACLQIYLTKLLSASRKNCGAEPFGRVQEKRIKRLVLVAIAGEGRYAVEGVDCLPRHRSVAIEGALADAANAVQLHPPNASHLSTVCFDEYVGGYTGVVITAVYAHADHTGAIESWAISP